MKEHSLIWQTPPQNSSAIAAAKEKWGGKSPRGEQNDTNNMHRAEFLVFFEHYSAVPTR